MGIIWIKWDLYGFIWDLYGMGPPFDSVQLTYKWLNSMDYGRYKELDNYCIVNGV